MRGGARHATPALPSRARGASRLCTLLQRHSGAARSDPRKPWTCPHAAAPVHDSASSPPPVALSEREMRAVARAAARYASAGAGDAAAARALSASASSHSAAAGAAPPRDGPANLELHRWAEGLKYGVPKFSGLATFFRQPFSPTLEGARPRTCRLQPAARRCAAGWPPGTPHARPCCRRGAYRRACAAAALCSFRRHNPVPPLCAARSPGLDIALVGIPYDTGANHPGTRLGPREIRNKSSVIRRCVWRRRAAWRCGGS